MKTKTMRVLERVLIFFVFAAMLFSIAISSRQAGARAASDIHTLEGRWFRYENGEKIPVEPPCRITLPKGQDLVLHYYGLTAKDGSKTLCTKGAVNFLEIRVGGRLIYQYDDTGFKRNEQMRAKLDCLAILPESPEGNVLTLTYRDTGSGVFQIHPVYLGRSGEILRQMWYDDMFMIVSVFTMVLIGVVAVCVHFYLRYLHMPDNRLSSAAAFLFLCAAWCLFDSSLTQQVQGLSPTICIITIYSFMSLTIPALHFVKNSGDMQKYPAFNILLLLSYGNILAQATIHTFFHVEYIDMLLATHVIQAVTCLTIAHLLNKEYQQTKDRELRAVLQAVFIVIVSSIVELVVYWLLKPSFYGLLLKIGILAFIIRLLFAILVSVTSNIQFKAEAMVYKRLSREDRLTGLGNRRAFDDRMAQLEENADQYQDVALFFLDVNGLKAVNDRYGHRAGDELIIGAARCLGYAFSGSENCFRVGGDEFAAIITNPALTAGEWARQIEDSVNIHNVTNRWHLSIAWGVSFLRDETGRVKRPSDWMFEADQAMYLNKNNMKANHMDGSEENR